MTQVKKAPCSKCGAILLSYWLRDGLCGACRGLPVVTAIPREYTYDRYINHRSVDCIAGLSFDAAVHLARVNSSITGDLCTVSCSEGKDGQGYESVRVMLYTNGEKTNEYLAGTD